VRRLVAALVCGGLPRQLFESGRDQSRPTKAITSYRTPNEQVNRNHERFPEDFMFQLTVEETTALTSQIAGSNLRSQIATSRTHGGRRYRPYAFTEHGSIMAANVLNSERAVQTSVQVVRAFVRLRQLLGSNTELARKLEELEGKYDRQFKTVFDAIRQLMSPPLPRRKQIGFRSRSAKK